MFTWEKLKMCTWEETKFPLVKCFWNRNSMIRKHLKNVEEDTGVKFNILCEII